MAIVPKKIIYDVAIKSTSHTRSYKKPPEVFTSDLHSVQFRFNLLDVEVAELNEGAAVSTIEITTRDGSFFQYVGETSLDGTTVVYDMKEAEGNHAGLAKIQLILKLGISEFTSDEYEFNIKNGLRTSVPVEIYVQNWDTLTAQANAYLTQMAADIQEFDVALENGVLATNIAAKLTELSTDFAPDLTAVKSGLATTQAQVDLLNRGLGATMNSLALLNATYPTGDTKDHIVAGNIAEVDTLTVTASPTVASNITITLNGVAVTVAVDPVVETTTALVATKIRGTVFVGWTTGGTGSVVTFTATATGAKTAPVFAGGTTGVTATFAITVKGENANYHRYFWNGTAWADGGAYQAIEAEDSSITPSKLKTTSIPVVKNLNNYTTIAATTSLYIPVTPLEKGIVNLVGKFRDGIVNFYLLKKVGGNFVVQKRVTKFVVEGPSSVITDFWSEGTGDEYIGFIGKFYFKNSGGVGFYEAYTADPASNLFPASLSTAGALYDLSVYPTYSSIELVDRIKDKASVEYVDQSLVFSLVSDTIVKALNTYTTAANSGNQKLYIPNVPLGAGNLVAHWQGVAESGTFYILEKTGSTFLVKRVKTVAVTTGENVIDMEYVCSGSGNEYFGYFARSFYKNIGGTGMYESSTTPFIVAEGTSFTPQDSTGGAGAAFDFGVYYEYTGQPVNVIDEVKNIRAELDALVIPEVTNDIASVDLTDFYMPHYTEIVEPIGYLGRWFDKTIDGIPCKVTINEGSEFYFKVKNTLAIAVNFKVITTSVMPYFAYSIDGAPLVRQLINNPNLPAVTAGEHVIRVVCDGLTEGENKWAGEIGIAVTGVTIDGGGTIRGVLPKNRTIMFFGDSITEGIRVLNMNANSDGNSGSGAFPFTTCKNLNAISYRVGFGASGVTHGGSGGVPDCLQYIDKMTSIRDAPYFEPDGIVINHGTNDAGATSQVFQAAYNAVLDRLRIKYPGVPIFTMIPFNQAKAADIRTCVSSRNDCYLVETSGWGVTYTDGTHPDIAGGITAGLKLADAIKAVLGEGYFIK